jgi:hypothetical protein
MAALSEDCVRTSEFYEALLELCASISSVIVGTSWTKCKDPNIVFQWSHAGSQHCITMVLFDFVFQFFRETATQLGFK